MFKDYYTDSSTLGEKSSRCVKIGNSSNRFLRPIKLFLSWFSFYTQSYIISISFLFQGAQPSSRLCRWKCEAGTPTQLQANRLFTANPRQDYIFFLLLSVAWKDMSTCVETPQTSRTRWCSVWTRSERQQAISPCSCSSQPIRHLPVWSDGVSSPSSSFRLGRG